eukprot:1187263-Prorocentrum_minimum.AAC.3
MTIMLRSVLGAVVGPERGAACGLHGRDAGGASPAPAEACQQGGGRDAADARRQQGSRQGICSLLSRDWLPLLVCAFFFLD